MKKTHLLKGTALTAAFGLLLTGCSSDNGNGEGGGDGETITIRVSHVNPPNSVDGEIVEEVAAAVAERSNGELVLEVYPSGQIGTTGDTAEQVANGENLIAFMDASAIGQMGAADFGMLGGPFLFDGLDEVNNFLDSDLFDDMAEEVAAEQGIRILSLGWVDGPRHIFADRPVPHPDDLEGLRFRTPPVDVWVDTFNLLGAVPTEVANTETYSALEQGVVDGAEGPINGTYPQRWQEVAPHVTLTAHFQTLIGYGISEALWQTLTPEQQTILSEEFINGGLAAQERFEAEVDDTMDLMTEESGVEFHEADTDAYRERTESYYDQYGDLYDLVREAATN